MTKGDSNHSELDTSNQNNRLLRHLVNKDCKLFSVNFAYVDKVDMLKVVKFSVNISLVLADKTDRALGR